MLHLSNLGIWSDEERWVRGKDHGKDEDGQENRRRVAEKNKSVNQVQWYTPTRHLLPIANIQYLPKLTY